MWADGKRVIVPYCKAQHLELFRLSSFGDLAPGTLGILEPKPELQNKTVAAPKCRNSTCWSSRGWPSTAKAAGLATAKAISIVAGPGTRPDAQVLRQRWPSSAELFDAVPVLPYDVRVDAVVTETDIYRRRLPRTLSCRTRSRSEHRPTMIRPIRPIGPMMGRRIFTSAG